MQEHSFVPDRFYFDEKNKFALSIKDQTIRGGISSHPLYPKGQKKQKTQVEILKDAIRSEDSSMKYRNFGLDDKEGILEDSEDWYYDKMTIVNEAGHTDQAEWLNFRAKL